MATNYLIWKEQLQQVIIVYGLKSLIKENFVSEPPVLKKTIITTDATRFSHTYEILEENIEHLIRERQDNAIKNCIYSSICSSHLKFLIGKHTSLNYCIALGKAFNDDSQRHLMDLQWRFLSLKVTLEQYINSTKNLINYLLAIADSIGEREQLLYVIGGLD